MKTFYLITGVICGLITISAAICTIALGYFYLYPEEGEMVIEVWYVAGATLLTLGSAMATRRAGIDYAAV